MFDSTIVLSTEGTILATDSSHFTLRSQGKKMGRIPPTMIGQMIVHPGVEITGKAFDRLGALGIPVTFLDREGRVRSRLIAPFKHDAAPRIEQVKTYLDPSGRLLLAKRWVDAKLANGAAVLQRHASNYPDSQLRRAAAQIRHLRSKITNASDISELMGFEGLAGRIYFSVFNRMLREDWLTFNGRNRRPPSDPANALLSYCYAILRNEILAMLEGAGLDAYIGYLHGPEPRRPALALDLMEPFRPVLADRLVLRLINLGTIKLEHFESRNPQPGIFITAEGRSAILEAVVPWSNSCDEFLDNKLHSPRGLLRKEIDRFATAAREEKILEFRPYYLLPEDSQSCPDLEL